MSRRPPPDDDPEFLRNLSRGRPPARDQPLSPQEQYEERMPRQRVPPPGAAAVPRVRTGFPSGCLGLIALVVALFILGPVLLGLSVDWQWFGGLGLQAVYSTRLAAGFAVWLVAFVVAILFLGGNWLLARRVATPRQLFPGQQLAVPRATMTGLIVAAVAVLALILAFAAGGAWSTVLSYFNRSAFGSADPIFGLDIGFYVFQLPFFEFLRSWALGLVVVAAIGAGAIYATRPDIFVSGGRFTPDERVVVHFTFLGVAFLLLMGVGYWFNQYDLLFSTHDALYGASYTDVNARLLAFRILLVVTVAIVLLLLVNLRVRALIPLAVAAGVWVLALILVGGVYPGLVQNLTVKPAELDKERPYIQNNIAATRTAFSLDKFNERPVEAQAQLSRADVESNRTLVNRIRLWDYRPLLDTYNQLQALRTYYNFRGVDLDRYQLASGEEQVMISARELNTARLQARTWLNEHLVYTHGYGVVASPVNAIENAGQPHFLVRDLPPVSEDPALAVTRPQIYYGEAEDNYVFVGTGTQEFDYPGSNNADVMTTYTGTGGVQVGGFLNRLQYAAYFGDFTVLISDLIHDDSRVLFHRDISDAVQRVAPFLSFDGDPYIVIAGGKLYWIQDAYTTTDRYPNSSPQDMGDGSVNYIRNSVKIVIDAYNGAMDFYVVDPSDPLIATYRRVFPTLFKDGATMPADLRAHLRYPEDLFNIQARAYGLFHMTDPQVFYNRGDAWRVPFGNGTDTNAPLEAYYTLMQLPGESKVGFMLLVPYTPTSKQNMIAWMAARSDQPDYGRVDVIHFPSNTNVFGPQQIDATINQDPQISQQLTLWNQSGSQVLLGNLLVIPVANSVLYVQPLFLQATGGSALPELKRVITAAGGQAGMGVDLNSALDSMFNSLASNPGSGGPGAGVTPLAGSTPLPGGTVGAPGTAAACTGTTQSLSADALAHYQRAQDALKVSDWATYGQEQAQVGADLRCLQQVTR